MVTALANLLTHTAGWILNSLEFEIVFLSISKLSSISEDMNIVWDFTRLQKKRWVTSLTEFDLYRIPTIAEMV